MKGLAGYLLAMVVGIVAVLLWMDGQESQRALQAAKQEAASAAEQREIWQARFAEASSSVKTQTVHVTKWATRYDTLRALVTDTVIRDSTVPTLGAVLEAADSTIAACRDLVSSCERFRVTADSTIGATARERDAFKVLWEKERPSKLDKLKPWAALGIGFYVGAKLRVP